MKVVWTKEGSRCPVRGCDKVRVAELYRDTLLNQGPQGGWSCENGHSGWVWPRECVIVIKKERK